MRYGDRRFRSFLSKSRRRLVPDAQGDWSSARGHLYPAADPTVEAIRKCRTLDKRPMEADNVGDFQMPRVSMMILPASSSRGTFLNSSWSTSSRRIPHDASASSNVTFWAPTRVRQEGN